MPKHAKVRDQAWWDERIDYDVNGGCWLWNRAINHHGYGTVWGGPSKTLVHRLSYEDRVDPIPAGLELDHLCRVKCCCNPAHLEPVTHAENVRRAMCLGAGPCRAGLHLMVPGNVYVHRDGSRECQRCVEKRRAAYYAANREKINARKRAKRLAARVARLVSGGECHELLGNPNWVGAK